MAYPAVQSTSSQTDAGTVATTTITAASGIQLNDLLLVYFGSNVASGPTGWVAYPSSPSTLWYKIATATEVAASNFTFTYSSSTRSESGMLRINGVYTTSPINATSTATSAGSVTSLNVGPITPTFTTTLLVFFGFNNVSPATFAYATANTTPTYTSQFTVNGFGTSIGAGSAQYAPATATGANTLTSSGNIAGTIISITPAQAVTVPLTIAGVLTGQVSPKFTATIILAITGVTAGYFQPTVNNVVKWVNRSKSAIIGFVNRTKS